MDPRLDNFIDMLRDLSAEQFSDDHMVRAVVEETRTFLEGGCDIDPAQREADGESHGRHLIYEDPCADFVVTAMAWPAGYRGAIHDHPTWGVVGVLEGQLEVTEYEAAEGGPLRETARFVAGPGAVGTVLPPGKDLHRMCNVGDGPALSIHVYGRAIARCRSYDQATGASEAIETRWTSVPAVTAS